MDEQKIRIERFENAVKFVDKLLPLLPDIAHFETSEIIINSDWSEEAKDEADKLATFIDNTIVKLEYARNKNDGYWFELTDKGREAKRAGGHFEYLKKLELRILADAERQKLNDEKLRYDVKNAKRIFKTYWWTFTFAVIGLTISLVLGFLKLLEVFQHTPAK